MSTFKLSINVTTTNFIPGLHDEWNGHMHDSDSREILLGGASHWVQNRLHTSSKKMGGTNGKELCCKQ